MTAESSSPSEPPPILNDRQAATDAKQLKLLAVFHWVFTGMLGVGLVMLFLHYLFLGYFMNNPEMWNESQGGPPPDEVFAIFKYFYIVMGLILLMASLSNALSARFVQVRKYRTFSLLVAGANCLMFPFGTILGVFAFVLLLRDSVAEIYAESEG